MKKRTKKQNDEVAMFVQIISLANKYVVKKLSPEQIVQLADGFFMFNQLSGFFNKYL